jgi:hypothetical protein
MPIHYVLVMLITKSLINRPVMKKIIQRVGCGGLLVRYKEIMARIS